MTFEVIPAIDVAKGRLVRMAGAQVVPIDAFEGDPAAAAATFVRAGATRLHVVDVDLALTAEPGALDALRAVAGLGVPVQAGGGVRSPAQVEQLLAAGADRVVLGSGALAYREATERLIASMGDRLCVGIEAEGATIRPRGRGAELPLWDTLVWLGEAGVSRYVYTDVGRSGALSGPDLDGAWALATHTGAPVIASGGIRSLEDLRAVAALGGGVEGAIVGRALYEGLDVREALAVSG
jgi:phosphoribosylformimino-5-aminoimidazole carboxamide ribonucleotide (ProFAR) isomerase